MKKTDLLGMIHVIMAVAFMGIMIIIWTQRDFAFWCFLCSVLLLLFNSFLVSVYVEKNGIRRGGLMYVPVALTLATVIVMTRQLPTIVDYNANKYLSAHICVFACSIIVQLVMFWKFDAAVSREGESSVKWNRIKNISVVLSGILMFTMFMVIFVDLKPVRRFLWRTMSDIMESRGEHDSAAFFRNLGVNDGDVLAADKAISALMELEDYDGAYNVMMAMKYSYGEDEKVQRWIEKYTPNAPTCSMESGIYRAPVKITFTKENENERLFISEEGADSRVYDNLEIYLDKRGTYQYSAYVKNSFDLESVRKYYDFYIDIPAPYTASGVIYDEILSSAENERGDWQRGYDKIIERWQQMNRGISSGYKYIYLNDDEIPELCLFSDDGTDRAMNLYTVVDGRIAYVSEYDMYGKPFLESVFTSIDKGGEEFYIEKTGIFIHNGKKTGTTYYDNYSLHHKWKQAMNGNRSVVDDCYEAYRLNGNRLEQIFYYIYVGDGAYEISYKKKDAEPEYVFKGEDKELAECDELSLIEAEYNFSYSDNKKIIYDE